MQTQNAPESVLSLLLDAPEEQVEACHKAMNHSARGEWRDAAKTLELAADWYPVGHVWADRAVALASTFRAK